MELMSKEAKETSGANRQVPETSVRDLDELQLALVGGGYGETIL